MPVSEVTMSTRVPYGHTDQMGHVYYGHALLYFEMARTEWMRAKGLTYRAFEQMGFFVPVIEAHVNYRASVHYDDLLLISCHASLLSRTRIRFDYTVHREGEERLLFEGWTVHAVTEQTGRPVRVPEALTSLL